GRPGGASAVGGGGRGTRPGALRAGSDPATPGRAVRAAAGKRAVTGDARTVYPSGVSGPIRPAGPGIDRTPRLALQLPGRPHLPLPDAVGGDARTVGTAADPPPAGLPPPGGHALAPELRALPGTVPGGVRGRAGPPRPAARPGRRP